MFDINEVDGILYEVDCAMVDVNSAYLYPLHLLHIRQSTTLYSKLTGP